MATEQTGNVFALELPLMYIEPNRELMQLYIAFGELAALERLHQSLHGAGATVKTVTAAYQPDQSTYRALMTIDTTGATVAPVGLVETLQALPGVELIQSIPPVPALAAAERNTVQVAGVPMAVIAKEVLGGAFQHLVQAGQPGAVYEAGRKMGRQAASAVPPLLEQLGLPLTLDLLQRRITDFQVFGWAEVRHVEVTEDLAGTLELNQSFESLPWQGKADRPTCDFIRGFTVGVFSFAFDHDFVSEETSCQGKGDAMCRITFRPA